MHALFIFLSLNFCCTYIMLILPHIWVISNCSKTDTSLIRLIITARIHVSVNFTENTPEYCRNFTAKYKNVVTDQVTAACDR